MRPTRNYAGVTSRFTVRGSATVLAVVVCGCITPLTTLGDILHLKSGGQIDGTIIKRDGQGYKVRTAVGTVTLPIDAVVKIDEQPSILDEYVKRREKIEDTAAAQVELANWCEQQELKAAWRTHMKRAVELDPNCAAARQALGYVLVNDVWVDGRSAEQQTAGQSKPTKNDVPDETGVITAIQSQWTVQIRALRKTMLESSSDRLIRDGREKILTISDPLAILPLTRILSDGNWACRETLVTALCAFPQDEATLNLAILALVDGNAEIRRRALSELKRRGDPRVIPQFRRALFSDNDELIKSAAVALGQLQATAAVLDLIDLLTVERVKQVEVSTRTYFLDYPIAFRNPTTVWLGSGMQYIHNPVIGIPIVTNNRVFIDREFQIRNVTVYRTEVMEALKQITGRNFGFDAKLWRRWYEEQQP